MYLDIFSCRQANESSLTSMQTNYLFILDHSFPPSKSGSRNFKLTMLYSILSTSQTFPLSIVQPNSTSLDNINVLHGSHYTQHTHDPMCRSLNISNPVFSDY
jgi:dipeptidase